ncbi:MAG: hypothetical protein AABZ47_15630 [Planctomycetota bacterium]
MGDHCEGTVCVSGEDQPCYDFNECTEDVCFLADAYAGYECYFINLSGIPCTDDDACTIEDMCVEGVCRGAPINCGSESSCTVGGYCHPSSGSCMDGIPRNCDDGNSNTSDDCAEGTGCLHEEICNDGDLCTLDEYIDGACVYTLVDTPPPVMDKCSTYGCTVNLVGLPQYLPINNDDDDGNGVADYFHGNMVNENEVICVQVASNGCPASGAPECSGHCTFDHWHYRSGPQSIGAYYSIQRDPIQEFNPGCPAWPPPETWCLEGRNPPSGCVSAWELQVVQGDPNTCCLWQSPSLPVVAVTNLEWEKADPTNADLDNCPNVGGRRIFPDRLSPGDTEAGIVRQRVKLVASVTPPVEDVIVHFRIFDVDDPFDGLHLPCIPGNSPPGCIRELEAIDDDLTGPDNRPNPETPMTDAAITDANGRAEVFLTVSMQPGNNYRAGASVIQEALNQNTEFAGVPVTPQEHADELNALGGSWSGFSCPLYWSPMLTVWRRVWLELDSMGSGSDISYTGSIDAIMNNSPHVGDGTVELDVPDINDGGRFEGGTLSVPATGSVYTIIDNIDATSDDDYTMDTPVASTDLGQEAVVTDDDAFVLPRTPNAIISVLDDKYKNCYVEFSEYGPARDNTVPFVAMMTRDPFNLINLATTDQDLHPAPNFWTALIVSGFQSYGVGLGNNEPEGASTADGGPDYWYHIHGPVTNPVSFKIGEILGHVFGLTPTSGSPVENVTIVFQEAIRDYIAQIQTGFFAGHSPSQTHAFMEARIIAHEIGHQFGIEAHIVNSLVDEWTGTDDELFGSQIAYIRSGTKMGEE